MRNKSIIQNTEQFLEEIKTLGEGKNICLGGNLYFYKHKEGRQSFQFRIFQNGKNTVERIGEYPETSYQDARSEATRRLKKVKKGRTQKAKVKRKGIKPPQEYCFKDLWQARKFIKKLSIFQNSSPEKSLEREIFDYLRLALINPTYADEIIDSQICDRTTPKIWRIINGISEEVQEDEGSSMPVSERDRTTYIEKYIYIAPATLFKPDPTRQWDEAAHLFPKLFKLSASDRKKKIAEQIQSFSCDYSIDPKEFKHFFRNMLVENCGFSESKVSRIIRKKEYCRWNSYEDWELEGIYEWWAIEIASSRRDF